MNYYGTLVFYFCMLIRKAEAKRLGCYNITLNEWEGNEGARKFYERLGMEPQRTTLELILK